jgi:LysM repeat protein
VRDSRSRRRIARYAAPAVFLLGVTIAVLLIRSGLGGGGGTPQPTLGPVTRTSTVKVVPKPGPTTASTGATTTAGAQLYTVRRGDTFGAIAAAEGTTVAELERLNPGVSSNALQVGQKIRVR